MLNRNRRYFLLGLLILAALILGAGAFLFAQAANAINHFSKEPPLAGAILKDRNGIELARLGTNRLFVPLDQIPRDLQTAVVDFQDEQFYEHQGRLRGTKTITQRLAEKARRPRSVWNRLQLQILPKLLERRYNKQEILEIYLNEADFGEGAMGVAAASQTYFGKRAERLSLAESALLAALADNPKAPSPFQNPQSALEVQKEVLRKMHHHGHLQKRRLETAENTPLDLRHHSPGKAHFFTDHISQILTNKLSTQEVFQGGLQVETTLDLKLQNIAETAFKRQNAQGALVAFNPAGQVLAMVGGPDYGDDKTNLATVKQQQVGFSLRPLIYAFALKKGWAMNHLVEDVEQEGVVNAGQRYWGPVTIKHALALNLNSASLWALQELGVDGFIDFAQRCGLQIDKKESAAALVMGDLDLGGLSLLQLAAAYLPLISDGLYGLPQVLQKVADAQGNELPGLASQPKQEQVLGKEEAYLLTNMLQASLQYGKAGDLEVEFPAAVMASGQWCLGYTPTLLVAVFVSANPQGETPLLAKDVWLDFMENAIEKKGDFIVPKRIQTGVLVDVFTGLLANERCPHVEEDAFLEGTAPRHWAPCAQPPPKPPQEPLTMPGAPFTPPPEPPLTQPPTPPKMPETAPPATEPPTPPEVPEIEPQLPPAEPEGENDNKEQKTREELPGDRPYRLEN